MKRMRLAILAGIGVFVMARALAGITAVAVGFFCVPAAWMAGHFLGVPLVNANSLPVLLHPALEIAVVPSCSGGDFFALLAGVMTTLAVRHRIRMGAWGLIPFLAYALTLAANTFRIVAAAQARLWAGMVPAVIPDDALHVAVGAAIFSIVLITTCRFLPSLYEHPRFRAR